MTSSSLAAPSTTMPLQTGVGRFSRDVNRADTIPASYLDASIPLNLPPRRSMKMLKDGSDFVWPDSAHALFVKGLQAWKALTYNSKRTRAPRGEGKTDFLVRYLQGHGVERTKKQVASHLQVLRTEWRNLDNPVLLSLVDEAHSRSMSEPSLPPLIIKPISSSSSPVFADSPDPNEDIATPLSNSPHRHSPLRQTVHSGRTNNPSQTLSVATEISNRIHSNPDISASWQLTNQSHSAWTNPPHLMVRQRGFSPNTQHTYHNMPYDSTLSHHDYERNAAGSLTSPPQAYSNTYYNIEPTSASPPRPISLSEGGSPVFYINPGNSNTYHQDFSSNDNSYAYQTRSHDGYGHMNYQTQGYTPTTAAGQETRRPSYPDLISPSTYNHPGFSDYDPPQSH